VRTSSVETEELLALVLAFKPILDRLEADLETKQQLLAVQRSGRAKLQLVAEPAS
jgi:hypothetical protein